MGEAGRTRAVLGEREAMRWLFWKPGPGGTPAVTTEREPPAPPRAPRVLLIGTSNAVFARGYAGGLAEAGSLDAVHNRSIGLATSALFTLQRPGIDFSSYDFCVLDFCCNEASLMEPGYIGEAPIRAQVEEAIGVVSAAGCVPVILIYPIAKALPDGGPVRRLYRALAETHGLPFLDGYDLVNATGLDPARLPLMFGDDMHIRRNVGYRIGQLLARALARLPPVDRSRAPSREVEGYAHRYLSAEAFADRDGDVLLDRRTRLASARCAVLGETDRRIALAPGEEVAALAADVGLSNSVVEVAGASRAAVRLSTEHFVPDGSRFVLGIWPLCPPVREAASGVTLSVRPDAMDGLLCGQGPVTAPPFRACLAGLVLRRPTRLRIAGVLPGAVDLAGLPGLGEAVAAVGEEAALSVAVEGLYREVLRRPADTSGLESYVDRLRGRDRDEALAAVRAEMMDSAEFRQLPGA